MTLQLLWHEYLEDHPGGYRYTQFCERYRRWRAKLRPTMRQVHRAGEKSFVDFSGKRPHLVDRRTGEIVPVELFVGVLGASSYTYAEAIPSQEIEHWIEAHEGMAKYFEGSTEIWVCDQLRSGVTAPCRYEPGINRTYAEPQRFLPAHIEHRMAGRRQRTRHAQKQGRLADAGLSADEDHRSRHDPAARETRPRSKRPCCSHSGGSWRCCGTRRSSH